MRKSLVGWLERMASWGGTLQKVVTLIPGVIGTLLWLSNGLEGLMGRNPLSNWLDLHPLGLLLLVVAPLLLSLTAFGGAAIATRRAPSRETAGRRLSERSSTGWERPVLAGTTTLSLMSTVALVAVLSTIVVRPAWCPRTLCPQPPGPHDEYVEAQLTTVRSQTFAMLEGPTAYSISHLPISDGPEAVPVERTLEAGKIPSGRPDLQYVIRLHSLRASGAETFIEAVRLVVKEKSPVQGTVAVWRKGATTNYSSEPYLAFYEGQDVGLQFVASYAGPVRAGSVTLKPGESDELSIGLRSTSSVWLVLGVQVEYRLGEEQRHRVLTFPYRLRVAFVDTASWLQYEIQGGRMVPA